MSKFRKGELVRCVDASGVVGLQHGRVYEVVAVLGNSVGLKGFSDQSWFWDDRFKRLYWGIPAVKEFAERTADVVRVTLEFSDGSVEDFSAALGDTVRYENVGTGKYRVEVERGGA